MHYLFLEHVLAIKEELQKNLSKIQTELPKPIFKQSSDCAVQTSIQPKEDKETEIDPKDEDDYQFEDSSSAELDKINEILKNTPLEPSNEHLDDTMLVSLARQFVNLKWKKDTLERKLQEQGRELQEAQQLRDSLQIDCEDMQTNIESLLLEIQHLKSNLPSIPEASEERVASLETETESLQEEIGCLRKANSAMSSELRTIKTAIKEEGATVDLTRIEALLESKKDNNDDKEPGELLQLTMDENTALRRRIDVLESELRVSLERCKGLDENIELIEELKLDLENARRELKIATSSNKRLENSLAMLQEAKNEVDADNEALAKEKEQLEADLSLLRESDLKRNDGEALAELREELRKTTEEKNDLEYDIRNMRNELDRTLEDAEMSRTRSEKLEMDNEQLVKENIKLLDQFSESQNESLDKIELLNTEMTLLQQELEACKEELEKTSRTLSETEERVTTLEKKNKRLKEEAAKVQEMDDENQKLRKELEELTLQKRLDNSKEELDSTLKRLGELEEKILMFEDENKRLHSEITRAGDLDGKNQALLEGIEVTREEILRKDEEIASITTKLKCTENYISTLEDENQLLEKKAEQEEIFHAENENVKLQVEQLKKQRESDENAMEAERRELKELLVMYQQGLEAVKTLENENQQLKVELEKLLVEKRDVEMNTSEPITTENSPPVTQLSDEERSHLTSQLAEKSKEIETLKSTIAKDKESALMARETVENLSQLISAKDTEIIKTNASFDALKHERDELVKLVQDKHNESLQYHAEIQRLTQLLTEQTTKLQKSIAEKDANLALLQEKESQLLWTQNELEVVKQRLQNIEETSKYEELCGVAEHTLLGKQVATLEEKSKALEAAVMQDQSNIRYLQEQLTEARSKETAALKEVERLRSHLVERETGYTEEALQSEEIQKTLEARLMLAEEKLKNSSTMYTSASVRANQQVETLQQQLGLIVQQRDDLQNKISVAEDKVLSYSASLTNLQLVLEQFQRGWCFFFNIVSAREILTD